MNLNEFQLDNIYCGEASQLLSQLPAACIDLTVTSPPYDNLRDYEGYKFDFFAIAKELVRVTKPGGVVVWVVGDQVKNGSETLNSFRQVIYFVELGMNLHDTMIYRKDGSPFPDVSRYYQVFEYMFVLSKGKPITVNLLRTKSKHAKSQPVVDETKTQRLADGSLKRMKYKQGYQTKVRDNVWYIPSGHGKSTLDKFAYDHPAMYPELLAQDHILSWSNPGDIVLDPMCGSGTTCKMAKQTGRRWIGFDISEKYVTLAKKRVLLAQPPLFQECHTTTHAGESATASAVSGPKQQSLFDVGGSEKSPPIP